MKVKEIKKFLEQVPDDLDVKFVNHKTNKTLGFWDCHEWYVCKKTYRDGGPLNEEFLAILVEDGEL